jgi:hypothetical protein
VKVEEVEVDVVLDFGSPQQGTEFIAADILQAVDHDWAEAWFVGDELGADLVHAVYHETFVRPLNQVPAEGGGGLHCFPLRADRTGDGVQDRCEMSQRLRLQGKEVKIF